MKSSSSSTNDWLDEWTEETDTNGPIEKLQQLQKLLATCTNESSRKGIEKLIELSVHQLKDDTKVSIGPNKQKHKVIYPENYSKVGVDILYLTNDEIKWMLLQQDTVFRKTKASTSKLRKTTVLCQTFRTEARLHHHHIAAIKRAITANVSTLTLVNRETLAEWKHMYKHFPYFNIPETTASTYKMHSDLATSKQTKTNDTLLSLAAQHRSNVQTLANKLRPSRLDRVIPGSHGSPAITNPNFTRKPLIQIALPSTPVGANMNVDTALLPRIKVSKPVPISSEEGIVLAWNQLGYPDVMLLLKFGTEKVESFKHEIHFCLCFHGQIVERYKLTNAVAIEYKSKAGVVPDIISTLCSTGIKNFPKFIADLSTNSSTTSATTTSAATTSSTTSAATTSSTTSATTTSAASSTTSVKVAIFHSSRSSTKPHAEKPADPILHVDNWPIKNDDSHHPKTNDACNQIDHASPTSTHNNLMLSATRGVAYTWDEVLQLCMGITTVTNKDYNMHKVNTYLNWDLIEFNRYITHDQINYEAIKNKLAERSDDLKIVFGGINHPSYLCRIAQQHPILLNAVRVYLLKACVTATTEYMGLADSAITDKLQDTYSLMAQDFSDNCKFLLGNDAKNNGSNDQTQEHKQVQ